MHIFIVMLTDRLLLLELHDITGIPVNLSTKFCGVLYHLPVWLQHTRRLSGFHKQWPKAMKVNYFVCEKN